MRHELAHAAGMRARRRQAYAEMRLPTEAQLARG
jgi:hypothetical protein